MPLKPAYVAAMLGTGFTDCASMASRRGQNAAVGAGCTYIIKFTCVYIYICIYIYIILYYIILYYIILYIYICLHALTCLYGVS